jgi:hypothetical protein
MAYDVSALSAYTKPNEDQLVSASIFAAKTQELIMSKGNVMQGVKSSENLNILSTDATFQAGGTCGFSSSGTTTFSTRTITVGKIKVQESLCPKSLESKYLQLKLKNGSTYTDAIFAQEYSDLKAQNIAKNLEVAIWQGDTTSGTGNLSKFDGFIKLIDAANLNSGGPVASNAKNATGTITSTTGSTSVSGTSTLFTTEVGVGDKVYSGSVLIGTVASITNATTLVLAANGAAAVTGAAYKLVPAASKSFASPVLATTGVTASNVRSIVTNIWQSIPAAIKGQDDVVIPVGWDFYETYIGALIEANLYNYSADNGAQKAGEIAIPGTQYKLIAVHGLDSTNRAYALRASNLYLAVDMKNEEEKFEIFFAKEADEVRFMAEWKTGVQVAFPSEIVQFTLA